MKNLLLSSVALIGLTAAAVAADLPSRRAPPPAYVAVPVFTWTGFYIGANAGYGFSDTESGFGAFGGGLTAVGPAVNTVVLPTPASGGIFGVQDNRNRDGFVGGGQLGYNYQFGSFVLGVEADIQYTDFGKRGSDVFGTAIPNANIAAVQPGAFGNVAFFNQNNKSDYFGTVRGRLGYAFDRVMIFGTGGVAFRDQGRRDEVIAAPFFVGGAGIGVARNRGEDTGYAVGGGVEYAFTPNITAKIEGLYVNFSDGNRNTGFATTPGQLVGVTNTGAGIVATGFSKKEDDFAVVRAGINYKFNLF